MCDFLLLLCLLSIGTERSEKKRNKAAENDIPMKKSKKEDMSAIDARMSKYEDVTIEKKRSKATENDIPMRDRFALVLLHDETTEGSTSTPMNRAGFVSFSVFTKTGDLGSGSDSFDGGLVALSTWPRCIQSH